MPTAPRFCLRVLLLAFSAAAAFMGVAGETSGAQSWRILEIRGAVSWRARAGSPSAALDARRDKGRVLRPEEELRPLGASSLVRIARGTREVVIRDSAHWYPVPHPFSRAASDRARQIAKLGVRAGRDRGPGAVASDALVAQIALLSPILAGYGDCSVAVRADVDMGIRSLATLPLTLPSTAQVVKQDSPYDILIVPAGGGKPDAPRVKAYRRDGSPICSGAGDDAMPTVWSGEDIAWDLGDIVTLECLRKGVLSLKNDAPDQRVRIGLRLMDVEWDTASNTVKRVVGPHQRTDEHGDLLVDVGDYVMLEVTNQGQDDCQATVLDLTDQAGFCPLWPTSKWHQQESPLIPAGAKPIILGRDTAAAWDGMNGVILIQPTQGLETIKVIAYNAERPGGSETGIAAQDWDTAEVRLRVRSGR